jgi:hypothetical protein
MKSILLGSIVAAALVFGGCGGSSSKSSSATSNDNGSTPEKKPEKEPETNSTNPETNTSDDTVTIGSLVWTKFKKDNDDDIQNDGKISYNDAKSACGGLGMSLPTIEQIESNLSAVATKLDFASVKQADSNATHKAALVFWDANDTQPAYYIDDTNLSEHYATALGNGDKYLRDVNESAYYTCVKHK